MLFLSAAVSIECYMGGLYWIFVLSNCILYKDYDLYHLFVVASRFSTVFQSMNSNYGYVSSVGFEANSYHVVVDRWVACDTGSPFMIYY